MKGGADKTPYELHQCNWERDFLTTAVPNPQQGANAPLVGLTVGDVATRSEDGTLSVQKQTVLVDEDGSQYGVSYRVSEDGERLVGVDYDPVSEKTPVTAIGSIRSKCCFVISLHSLVNQTNAYSTSSYRDWETDRKSTRLNSSHITRSRMPSSA